MFFFLSKTIYFLAMPFSLILICFFFSYYTRRKKYKLLAFRSGIILALFFSNNFIINELFLTWEIAPTTLSDIDKTYDVGIVLTGITNLEKSPKDRVYFNKGADRITHAVRLYQDGIIKKIMISGGSGSLYEKEKTESENLMEFLLMLGIPPSDIIIENQSRNTHENASFSAALLSDQYPEGQFLLITSAFHMRRALKCFEKENMKMDHFSADFYSHDRNFHFDTLIIPNIYAIDKWTTLFREIIGIILYKFAGYI